MARPVSVLRDIQSGEPRREFQRREMVGRQGRDHRHLGQDGFQRQHGLDSLAGEENVADAAEADAIAEEMPERPARIRQRRFLSADPIEPGAVNTGDPAMRIGDSGKQPWP